MVQGTTIGPLIRLLRLQAVDCGKRPSARRRNGADGCGTVCCCRALIAAADGSQKHPRLLEQYGYRARLTERFSGEAGARAAARKEHFEVVLAAIAAGARRS
jgi:CPA1 family monovalent cation:H+ antiporter